MKLWLKTHRVVRGLLIFLLVLLCIALCVLIFMKVWPAFGGTPTKADKENYASRAENFRDGKFFDPQVSALMSDETATDEGTRSQKSEQPQDTLPVAAPDGLSTPPMEQVHVTWLGHSSLLIQMHGLNILVDPVLSETASPVSFAGPKRFSPLPLTAQQMPHIDILLISHDHYDHLDYQTIRALDGKVDRYVVPLGVEKHLERGDVSAEKIQNLAWWEEATIEGLTLACTPAKHYSSRNLNDRGQTLWASWVLKDEFHQIYESGDSGYGDHFADIHARYGDFDLALMDCAQYNMRWHDIHMFPE